MRYMNKPLPTAAKRIAETIRAHRTAGAWDQATMAALLTALGSATKPSTITRIESGDQGVTIEQLLLLALVMPQGLRDLLAPPFTIGTLAVRDQADLDALLAGTHIDHNGVAIQTALDEAAFGIINPLWDDQRHASIATSLGTTPRKVANAAQRLYGHGADQEVNARFTARLAEVTPKPKPETAQWRAYRSHAVRAVTKEIGEALR